ncbi:MAG: cryptochrome/photolyase family protein [Bacteroidota bacterium]
MSVAALVYPNQLFADHPALAGEADRVVLHEDDLFFRDEQYPARYHRLRLALHRATMRRYARGQSGAGRVGVEDERHKAALGGVP